MSENQNKKDQEASKPIDKKAALEELIKAKAANGKNFGKGNKNNGFGPSFGGKSANSAGKGAVKMHRSNSK